MTLSLEDLKKDDIKIEFLLKIKEIIKGTQWENRVFVAASTVREIILHKPITNIHLVVTQANGGVEFAEWLAIHTDCYRVDTNPVVNQSTGIGRVRILSLDKFKNFELHISMSRKDDYSFGSLCARAVFGTLVDDSKKRDFTINALYIQLSSGHLYNPGDEAHGLDVITNAEIKTVGDPDETFECDPIKMLRAIRLSALYGWGIEKNTWFSIIKNKHLLCSVDRYDQRRELIAILTSDNPYYGIEHLKQCGLLKHIIPELYKLFNVFDKGINSYYHTLHVLQKVDNNAIARMSALLHEIGKIDREDMLNNRKKYLGYEKRGKEIAEMILKRLGFSDEFCTSVKVCIENQSHFKYVQPGFVPADKTIRAFIQETKGLLNDTLSLIDADVNSMLKKDHNDIVERVKKRIAELKKIEEESKVKLPLNGKDIMDAFKLKSTPFIGELLSYVTNWTKVDEHITKEQCLERLKDIVIPTLCK